MRRPYDEVARDFLVKFHPDAACAIIGGSIATGQGTATSDIDIVVLYDDSYQTPHRESLFFQDWMIESFIHTPKAQDYFFENDRLSGSALMADLVMNGHLIGPQPLLGKEQQRKARAIFDAGPVPYSDEDILKGRYFVTDQLDDLLGSFKQDETFAILARFYHQMLEFHLRIHGQWTGNGKWMMRRLRKLDPDFAVRYTEAFKTAFTGNIDAVASLTREILAPYGGECREWKAFAPDDWKTHTQ